jgi:hypothetical protein
MLKRGLQWAITTAVLVFLMFRLFDGLGVSVARGTDQWYIAGGAVAVPYSCGSGSPVVLGARAAGSIEGQD